MAHPLFVLCRSSEPVTLDSLLMSLGKEPALQEAEVESRPGDGPSGWSLLTVHYARGVKPIVVSYYSGDECSQAVAGIVDELPPPTNPDQHRVLAQLSEVRQVLRIDLDPARLPEEVWQAIDCVEAYLAFRYDGVVFAPGEGIYDEGLALLYPV